MPPVSSDYTLKSWGKHHSNFEGSRSLSSHNLHKWGTQNLVTLSSRLSAALFSDISDISLFWPSKLVCAVFNPISAICPILTPPSQASVYDRGLRTGSKVGAGQAAAAVTDVSLCCRSSWWWCRAGATCRSTETVSPGNDNICWCSSQFTVSHRFIFVVNYCYKWFVVCYIFSLHFLHEILYLKYHVSIICIPCLLCTADSLVCYSIL